MDLLKDFLDVYFLYCRELWLTLAVGFLISGFFFKFIPSGIVERHLGETGLKPILLLATIGVFLPVCCIGVLPIALTLKRKGAALGAVLAFLVATPATSVSALIVCWRLLGLEFSVVIFISVILMALVLGGIINKFGMSIISPQAIVSGNEGLSCHPEVSSDTKIRSGSCGCVDTDPGGGARGIWQKFVEVLHYSFIILPRQIGIDILVGIAVASFITVFEPIQHLIQTHVSGMAGYGVVLIIGLLTYVCSTASVPLADAFIQSGMSSGQALCYLLVGPITSYGTIFVIRKDFGWRVLLIYLSVISVLSVAFGLVYDLFLNPA